VLAHPCDRLAVFVDSLVFVDVHDSSPFNAVVRTLPGGAGVRRHRGPHPLAPTQSVSVCQSGESSRAVSISRRSAEPRNGAAQSEARRAPPRGEDRLVSMEEARARDGQALSRDEEALVQDRRAAVRARRALPRDEDMPVQRGRAFVRARRPLSHHEERLVPRGRPLVRLGRSLHPDERRVPHLGRTAVRTRRPPHPLEKRLSRLGQPP
jgi:hypothetical protein